METTNCTLASTTAPLVFEDHIWLVAIRKSGIFPVSGSPRACTRRSIECRQIDHRQSVGAAAAKCRFQATRLSLRQRVAVRSSQRAAAPTVAPVLARGEALTRLWNTTFVAEESTTTMSPGSI